MFQYALNEQLSSQKYWLYSISITLYDFCPVAIATVTSTKLTPGPEVWYQSEPVLYIFPELCKLFLAQHYA